MEKTWKCGKEFVIAKLSDDAKLKNICKVLKTAL